MESFLFSSLEKLSQISVKKMTIVLGNESADLDSVVCSIVYAYYLEKVKKIAAIPLLHLSKYHDLALRTELSHHLYKECGLSSEIRIPVLGDARELMKQCQDMFDLHLIDHHAMTLNTMCFESNVVQIFDHREIIEGSIGDRLMKKEVSHKNVTIERVASCATLIAELIKTNCWSSELDDYTYFKKKWTLPLKMLYGVILVDSYCLKRELGKTTCKDVEIVTWIESIILDSAISDVLDVASFRNAMHSRLTAAKWDISSLSTFDLLRKDLKLVSKNRTYYIAVPSVIGLTLEDVINRQEFLRESWSFLHVYEPHIPLMAINISSKFSCRWLVFVNFLNVNRMDERDVMGQNMKEQLLEYLNEDVDAAAAELDLLPVDLPFQFNCQARASQVHQVMDAFSLSLRADANVHIFKYQNVTATRKQLMPIFERFIAQYVKNPGSPIVNSDDMPNPIILSGALNNNFEFHNEEEDAGTEPYHSRHFNLPTLNNKKTVELVNKKRQNLDNQPPCSSSSYLEKCTLFSDDVFTPNNSETEESLSTIDDCAKGRGAPRPEDFKRDLSLPSLNNKETIIKVHKKRISLSKINNSSSSPLSPMLELQQENLNKYSNNNDSTVPEIFTPTNSDHNDDEDTASVRSALSETSSSIVLSERGDFFSNENLRELIDTRRDMWEASSLKWFSSHNCEIQGSVSSTACEIESFQTFIELCHCIYECHKIAVCAEEIVRIVSEDDIKKDQHRNIPFGLRDIQYVLQLLEKENNLINENTKFEEMFAQYNAWSLSEEEEVFGVRKGDVFDDCDYSSINEKTIKGSIFN